jgi:hypothetical protein
LEGYWAEASVTIAAAVATVQAMAAKNSLHVLIDFIWNTGQKGALL